MGMGFCRRSIVAAAGLAVVAAGGLSTGASAGAIRGYAMNAETLLEQGKPADALAAFDKATAAFWAALPLQFRVARFVTKVSGFASYTEKDDASFHSGDTATVYLEPVGYGFSHAASAAMVAFTTAVEIRTPGGIVLARTDNLGRIEWTGQHENYAVPAVVSVTLPTLKPGDYTLALTLTDEVSKKQASTTLPFSIAE